MTQSIGYTTDTGTVALSEVQRCSACGTFPNFLLFAGECGCQGFPLRVPMPGPPAEIRLLLRGVEVSERCGKAVERISRMRNQPAAERLLARLEREIARAEDCADSQDHVERFVPLFEDREQAP